ncbi:DUF2064 domain-containing protein [Robiginitalea sp. IMCC43444]|uniref:DUF2064 domain-containing protein n=1 Tax=Robiginitalea sp. IMCC43444 TaxID=3459121 RepID=UPI0040416613
MRPPDTAILVFAQSAKKDSLDKGVLKGELLFDQLTQEAIQKAKRSGLPYFHIGEQQQVGAHFGIRLTNAMQGIYEKGYKKLIVIGNDSPDLKTATLIQAANMVDAGKPVLGPSNDGGVYLIGLDRSDFHFEAFIKLPWNLGSLRTAMTSWLNTLSAEPYNLTPLMELDSEWDFKVWLKLNTQSGRRLLKLFLLILTHFATAVSAVILFLRKIYFRIFRNKGSPDLLRISFV